MTEFLTRLFVTVVPVAIVLAWWAWRSVREGRARIAAYEAASAEYHERSAKQIAEWRADAKRFRKRQLRRLARLRLRIQALEKRDDPGEPGGTAP